MEDERVVLMSTKGYQSLTASDNGKNLFWTPDMDYELPIKVKSFGAGSEAPRTVAQAFYDISEKQGDKPALWIERNGKVLCWSWRQYQADAFAFAKACHALGLQERKCINIMGHNSPEWVITFMGGVIFNNVVSGVYPTNNADACLYQADHSEAEIIVVDSLDQAKKYEVNFHKLPNIKAIVIYSQEKLSSDVKDKRYYLWQDFLNLGKDVKNEVVHEKIKKQKPGKCCALIYTSGTTGNPKACMISNDNLIWSVETCYKASTLENDPVTENDRIVSYLPLSHIAGLLFDCAGQLYKGHQVYFARPDAL